MLVRHDENSTAGLMLARHNENSTAGLIIACSSRWEFYRLVCGFWSYAGSSGRDLWRLVLCRFVRTRSVVPGLMQFVRTRSVAPDLMHVRQGEICGFWRYAVRQDEIRGFWCYAVRQDEIRGAWSAREAGTSSGKRSKFFKLSAGRARHSNPICNNNSGRNIKGRDRHTAG